MDYSNYIHVYYVHCEYYLGTIINIISAGVNASIQDKCESLFIFDYWFKSGGLYHRIHTTPLHLNQLECFCEVLETSSYITCQLQSYIELFMLPT